MERVTFDEHIRRNQRVSVLVLAFMFLLLWGAVYATGYLLGTPPTFTLVLGLVVAAAYLLFTYARSTETVLLAAKARPADPARRAEKLLLHRVEEMAIASGLPPPKVYVQDSRDINAFVTGLTPEKSVMCVTTGALEQLDQEELEGVIAHEMSHILNRDMRIATITVGVVGAVAMLAEIGLRLAWYGGAARDRRGGHPALLVLALVGLLLAPLFSRLTYLFLSRRREYLADASGAMLTRNPRGLAGALEKIRGDVPDDPKGSRTVAGLYFANPWTRKHLGSAFSTHPPLEERIRRLRSM